MSANKEALNNDEVISANEEVLNNDEVISADKEILNNNEVMSVNNKILNKEFADNEIISEESNDKSDKIIDKSLSNK